jgi:hypothetical protein
VLISRAEDERVEAAAERAGQTPALARDALSGAIETGRTVQNYDDVIHIAMAYRNGISFEQ